MTEANMTDDVVEKPKRIQLSRAKGWRMPAGAVKVDRSTPFGNPCDWREWLENAPRDVLWTAADRAAWAKAQAVDCFEEELRAGSITMPLADLRGKDLACWCAPHERCHADVLLELANESMLAASSKGER